MSSSEAPALAEPARISVYAFEQLDAPQGPVGGVADVLSAAWAEAEQVRAQARAAGEAEGRALGIEAARAEVETALAAVGAAVQEIEQLRAQLVEALERDAVELALSLGEQVVAGALEVQPERLIDIARGALRRIAERHRVTLVVNPDDLELLQGAAAGLSGELGGIDHLDVQSDRRIGRGGALARTESGEIDATVTAQLQSAREVIAATLSAGDSGE